MAQMDNGTRLAFVVLPLKGKVMRERVEFVETKAGKNKDGSPRMVHTMKRVEKEEPAGFMVYFPRGHAIRVRTEAELKAYNLDGKPNFINLDGLHDPKSPIGRLLHEQDAAGRAGAYADLQRQVVGLATKKSGGVLMPEQIAAAIDVVEAANLGKKQEAKHVS